MIDYDRHLKFLSSPYNWFCQDFLKKWMKQKHTDINSKKNYNYFLNLR